MARQADRFSNHRLPGCVSLTTRWLDEFITWCGCGLELADVHETPDLQLLQALSTSVATVIVIKFIVAAALTGFQPDGFVGPPVFTLIGFRYQLEKNEQCCFESA